MELHLVHWNTRYGNSTDAQKKRDGLGVLGLLFDVSGKARDFQEFDRDDKLSVRIHTRDLLVQLIQLCIQPTSSHPGPDSHCFCYIAYLGKVKK